jgi:MFS transporter, ACS family, tartrate transporter
MSEHAGIRSGIEHRVINRVYWRFIPLFFLCMFFNYLDRANVSFAALRMNKDLGLGPAEFGLAGSVFFFGYMLLGIPSNILLCKTGAKAWLALLLVLWGVCASATAFVGNAIGFYVVRFLIGIAESGFLPGLAFFMTLWFPKAYRARAIAGYIIAISVASVLGGPLTTAIMTFVDGSLGSAAGMHGWRWMFIVEGIPTVVLGLFTFFHLSDSPSEANWLTAAEKRWLIDVLAAEKAETEKTETPGVVDVIGDIRVWSLAFLFGCALVGFYGLLLWLPLIVKDLGELSDLQVGFLSALPPLLGVIGTLIVSRSSDRTGDRKFHLGGLYFVAAAGLLASAYAGSPAMAYVLLCVAGLCLNSGNSLFWSLASSIGFGAAAAVAVAAVNTIAQFGGLVGPYVIGIARAQTGNFTAALVVVSVFVFMSAAVAIVLPVKKGSAA